MDYEPYREYEYFIDVHAQCKHEKMLMLMHVYLITMMKLNSQFPIPFSFTNSTHLSHT